MIKDCPVTVGCLVVLFKIGSKRHARPLCIEHAFISFVMDIPGNEFIPGYLVHFFEIVLPDVFIICAVFHKYAGRAVHRVAYAGKDKITLKIGTEQLFGLVKIRMLVQFFFACVVLTEGMAQCCGAGSWQFNKYVLMLVTDYHYFFQTISFYVLLPKNLFL